MTRIHKLSAAAFLLGAALPALADPPRILNVGVSNRQVLGACPNRTLNAVGTLSYLLSGTISYYLQADDGRQSAHVTVTLPDGGDPVPFNLTVPIPATAGSATFIMTGVSANSPQGVRLPYPACPAQGTVTGFTIASTDVSGHCTLSSIVLHTTVTTTGGPVTVTYAPVLNNVNGSAYTVNYTSAGSNPLDITVHTSTTAAGSVGAVISAPVALSGGKTTFAACPPPQTKSTTKKTAQ